MLATGTGAQPAAPAKLVPAQSEITFQVKQSGVPIDGRFRKFDAQLALDPKAPQTGTVSITVDTGSATVGFAESDAELPRAPWFNSAKFPRAVFQSATASIIARAQRSALVASAGPARGVPKVAITASPRYLSTVPP